MLELKSLKFLTIKHTFLLALAITPIFVIFPKLLVTEYNEFSLFYISNQSKLILISFSMVAFLVILHAKDIHKFEMLSIIFYTLSSFAAILSYNIILLSIFIEFMVFGAFSIIASNHRKSNIGPAVRYAIVHFFAGTLILLAVAVQLNEFNFNMIFHSVLNFQNFRLQVRISYIMMLAGLLINCGSFPFSHWIVDSYPATTLHSTPYLSIFTTKVSSYILLLIFQGSEILFYFGLVTAFCAVGFAIFENNMRCLLCYNLIGQMGLIITGIGFSSKSAEVGIILQIIFCTIYQSLLFIIVNSIITRTKKHNLNEVGNLLKKMPIEALCSFVAIFTMVGAFGTPTFISKSLITLDASVNVWAKTLFSLANLMLFMSVGLKFFYFVFIYKREQKIVERGNIENFVPMSILSIICIITGTFYNQYLPYLLKDIPIFHQSKNVLANISTVTCCITLFPLCNLLCLRVASNLNFRSFLSHKISLYEKFVLFTVNVNVNIIKNIASSAIKLYSSAVKISIIKNIASSAIKLYSSAVKISLDVTTVLATIIISTLLIFLCLSRLLIT